MNRERNLTLQEHQNAVRVYNAMAVIFTSEAREGDNPVLARNRFVEVTIIECLEEIGDERVLLEAWRIWVRGRNVAGLTWHVTKFQTEYAGLIPAARNEVEFLEQQARHDAARRARSKVGAR
jgi:hypothetical protein